MAELALAIAVKGAWDAQALWDALAANGALDGSIEIHLACERIEGKVPEPVEVHVRQGLSLFGLWGIAAARTTAPYVAILYGVAPPAPSWLGAMQAELGGGNALCGPVEPLYAPSDPRITGYLVEYCQFHRPHAPGLAEVPGNNLILPRAMLAAPEVLEREGFSKTPMLAAGTLAPRWIDEALVHHNRAFTLGAFCGRRFRHGRSYGAARMSGPEAPPRWIAMGFAFALPLVRTARILRHAWRIPRLRGPAILRLPAIFTAETCWSAGEFVGYALGTPGNPVGLD